MISITLEFKTVDEAIVALAKHTQLKAGASCTPMSGVVLANPDKPKRGRGRPKKAAEAPDVIEATPVPELLGSVQPDVPPATLRDAQVALQSVLDAKGVNPAIDLLSRYGVTRLSDMLPEQYGQFVAEAGTV